MVPLFLRNSGGAQGVDFQSQTFRVGVLVNGSANMVGDTKLRTQTHGFDGRGSCVIRLASLNIGNDKKCTWTVIVGLTGQQRKTYINGLLVPPRQIVCNC